jgi:nucleotide-binding universal stress UspA family protein
VKIKPMLARLQSAIGRDDLIEQMVLLSEPKKSFSKRVAKAKSANLIVGYNGSPQSHTALDIACWIAHQTSLATNTQVTVQAVYVLEENFNYQSVDIFNLRDNQLSLERELSNISKPANFLLAQSKVTAILPHLETEFRISLKEADRILWQAKTLAQEWQGFFKSHLRFGNIAQELKKVVQSEIADILFLGCQSNDHSMIEALGSNFPCAVLGIPHSID